MAEIGNCRRRATLNRPPPESAYDGFAIRTGGVQISTGPLRNTLWENEKPVLGVFCACLLWNCDSLVAKTKEHEGLREGKGRMWHVVAPVGEDGYSDHTT
jgi:hypothetical protein